MTQPPLPALPPGFELSDDVERIDRALVHSWLSEQAYWSLGRPREMQDRAIEGSWNFGVYRVGTGEQVAYARVVTDRATFAWICDVFVDSSARGLGVGTALIAGVVAALEPLAMGRVVLATRDAHELYTKFGFEHIPNPERWMSKLAQPAQSSG